MSIELQRLGAYAAGAYNVGAAEIPAFDPASKRLFVVNGSSNGIDVLDLADPAKPALLLTLDIAGLIGGAPNSVAVRDGLVAVAVENGTVTDPGVVAFFDAASSAYLGQTPVGALPDMLTFSPDGTTVLVANEGEPSDGIDPDGSVSIITLGAGPTLQARVDGATVATATFTAFNGKEHDLRNDGIVIAPGTTAAQDFEPEYIALSADGKTAYVTLQENNGLAIVDVAAAKVTAVLPLGVSDFSRDLPKLTQIPFDDVPDLGATAEGQTIKLGGFSGLWFEGTDAITGKLNFVTVPDRGPNGEPINADGDAALERPFLLPDYQARVVRFSVDPLSGTTEITDEIPLVRSDGVTPITGLPNIPGKDEEPVEKLADGSYRFLAYDAFGADLEGVIVAKDGSFWMVDEYRPAIYHFAADGVLIDRFVPAGTAALVAGAGVGDFGSETLPEDYASRRPNRGFEAIAYDPGGSGGNGTVYAFIQTPLANPNTATSTASTVIRILGVDAASGVPVSEHLYLLEKPGARDAADGTIDKIGDAVWLGGGRIAVLERGDSLDATAKKFIFEIDVTAATNLLDPAAPGLPAGQSLEQQTADSLAALGIVPATKVKVLNLPSLGYLPSDKPEGLALIGDGPFRGSYAVLNDNDFGLVEDAATIALGLVSFGGGSNGLDPSDRDGGIRIGHWPVYGLYQPDAIASFVIDGRAYLITANEGDLRDPEKARVGSLTLDPTTFPNANAIQANSALGRLEVATSIGDDDGDGDFDALFAAGSRGFTIWDEFGNLVFSSGDQFERITAERYPNTFNANSTNNTLDNRSDEKGPEPEGVVVGTIDGATYAFIGLERIGGVMVYDVSTPKAPSFVQYINPRDFSVTPGLGAGGDLGPEGLAFVPAEDSPNGRPLLVVANEISGTTAIFQINARPLINEFVANHVGTDTVEYVEIFGSANADYSAYSILQIEGDAGATGTVDSVFRVGTADVAGFWQTPFLTNVLENGTMSLLLVRDFTGAAGQDLDSNDDGILDVTPWSALADSIAVSDGGAGDRTYGAVTLLSNFDGGSFTVGGASRIPNGTDTRAPVDWVRNDFDLAGIPSFQGTPVVGEALNTPWAVNALVPPPPPIKTAAIYDIQGAGHRSPFAGEQVKTSGIVTAIDGIGSVRGFWIQDPIGDGNVATSDGIFVFTGSETPAVAIGDGVEVTGRVTEFRPSSRPNDLTLTELTDAGVAVRSSGNALPAATVIGAGGRLPPTEIIDSDGLTVFNPGVDGIDFYESLEGMRVQVNNAVAVQAQPANFGEIAVLADGGAGAGERSGNGGIVIRPGDFNPERIIIDDTLVANPPQVTVGDGFAEPIVGVLDYTFGNFKLFNGEPLPAPVSGGTTPEVTNLFGTATQVTIATFNVENLDPGDGTRFARLGQQIVTNLGAPDIIALQEVQDNDGPVVSDITAADLTLQTLAGAVFAAGGPQYAFLDNPFIGNGTNGGQPGGNIRVAYLYNPDRVTFVDGSLAAVTDPADQQTNPANPFFDSRLPLAATFQFNGQDITLINNHFNSKGGDTPLFGAVQPPLLASEAQRLQQAEAINGYVGSLLAADPGARVVVLGDLNDFEFSAPLATVAGDLLTNLTADVPLPERYTFNFEGNGQVLDHILVSDALLGSSADDTLAEIDILHVNTDFPDPIRASDHDPQVARLTVEPKMPDTFFLQLLHFSDQEAGIPALTDAPNLSGVLNALRNQFPANTLTLSSGDAYLPGVFFNASIDVFGAAGRADILIQNELGVQAIAFGNHEFDLGTATVANLIRQAPASGGFPAYPGTSYPYLSSNLNFAPNSDLRGLVVPAGQTPLPNTITESVVFTVNGEQVGVVGATTPLLRTISSPGTVGVIPPDPNDIAALAAEIQVSVDQLTAQGIDKIVLLAHMQQFSIEFELAELLKNVDIIVAGGSHSVFADSTDILRPGDAAEADYPTLFRDADGNPVAVVNTGANYRYVGRLVVEFDDAGLIVPTSIDPDVSGAYATDAEGLARVGGESLIDEEIVAIVDSLEGFILAKDSNVFGITAEFLNGQRGGSADARDGVRTQETNFGNLTADANLAVAQKTDASVVVSIKNGGGIRDSIGQIYVPGGGTEPPLRLPPAANEPAGKPEGGVSQLDIENALRFNNGLTLLTVTAAQLKQVLEHAVAVVTGTPGQFGQFGGVNFSFDGSKPAGSRVQSAMIVDDEGNVLDTLVLDSEVVGDPGRAIRLVTLSFLANGGDRYPFPAFIAADPAFANRVDLVVPGAPRTGTATFTDDGSEQDALAEFLAARHPTVDTAFSRTDTPASEDTRIQNLGVRADGIPDVIDATPGVILGDNATNDSLSGGSGAETLLGRGGNDTLRGFSDDDLLDGGAGNDLLFGGSGDDTANGGAGDDTVLGGSGDDLLLGADGNDSANGGSGNDTLDLGAGNDTGIGGAGNDSIELAAGDDSAKGEAGDDSIAGAAGGDTLDGGAGNDTVDGGAGADSLLGGDDRDQLTGGDDDDTLSGGAGSDTLQGGEGDDRLGGDFGNDRLEGGNGDDVLDGGAGVDTLLGGAGDDELRGGIGNDVLTGGEGDDIFILAPNEGRDSVTDFMIGEDLFGLTGGLTFDDLAFRPGLGGTTVISAGGAALATVTIVGGGSLSDGDFFLL